MRQLLDEFEAKLLALPRAIAVQRLAAGASAGSVERALRTAGIEVSPPAALTAFYEWHDGQTRSTDAMGDLWLVPGYLPVDLAEAVVIHQAGMTAVADLEASDPDPEGWGSVWQQAWWPLLRDSSSGNFVVDLSRATAEDAPVLRTDPEEGVLCTHSSIRAMVSVFKECLTQGAYFLDEHGDYEVDDVLEGRLSTEIDPAGDFSEFD